MNLKRILAMMLCLCLMLACVPVVGVPVRATTEKQYVTIEAEDTNYAVWNKYSKTEGNSNASGGNMAAGGGGYFGWFDDPNSDKDLVNGFIDKSNSTYVAFYVKAEQAGTYYLSTAGTFWCSASYLNIAANGGENYFAAFLVNPSRKLTNPDATVAYKANYIGGNVSGSRGSFLSTEEVEVSLEKGLNVIYLQPMTREQDGSANWTDEEMTQKGTQNGWANVDCLRITGEHTVTAVKAQETVLHAGDAPYVYGYTTVNAGANVGAGGWGDNTIPISNMSTSNVEKLRSFTYTVNAPQNGYYDITVEYDGAGNGSDTRAIGLLVDGKAYAYEFKHLDNTNTSGGKVNLSVYLTEGDHVLTFTAPAKRTAEDDCGTGNASTTKNVSWFDYNEIYLYGGLTKSVIQSNPKLDWWYAEAEYRDAGYALWHTYGTTETSTDAKRDYNGANYPDKGTGKVIGGGNTILNPALADLQSGILDKATVSGVSIYVDAPAAGTYSFKARYRLNNPGIWDSTNKTWTEDPYSVFMVNGEFGNQAFFDKAAQYNWTYDTYVTELTLREGINEITFLPMVADQRKSGSDWVNVDCIFVDTDLQVAKVPTSVTFGPSQGYTHLYSNVSDTAAGGGDYDAAKANKVNLAELVESDLHNIPFVAYTVDVPESGYYEIVTNYGTYADNSSAQMGYMIDGQVYITERYSSHCDAWVYMTAGTHTLVVTCLLPEDAAASESSSYGWSDLKTTTITGGLTLAQAQKNPLANVPVRFEAENGVIGRYTSTNEAGKSGTVVGGINYDATFMQTFADMQARGLVDKSGIPYVSYMVNVPESGSYTLRSVYRVVMKSGYDVADYYMTASVNDRDFYKLVYSPYGEETNGWAQSETVVNLEKGYNVIRMISLNADNAASVSWLNQDYIEIVGVQAVAPVTQTANYFQSGEAQYYNGYTTVKPGATYDWAKSYLGGIDKITMTYDMLDYTTIKELAWVSYTLEIPADGYYDMHTTINTGGAAEGYIILVIDGEKYQMPVAEVTEGFKKNKQNLTTYLTEGTHTILVSALCGSSAAWCDMAALTVYGEGVKLAETQIDPVTLMKVPEGLVEGSAYTIIDGVLTIGTNVDVLALKSNFHGSVTVSDSEGNILSDDAIVPDGAVVSYASGTSYTVKAENPADQNGDGKTDIRDLKVVNEKHLAGDDQTDLLSMIKNVIFSCKSYQTASIGADAMLAYCNPVGRPTKVGNALYLEPSASNLTLTGEFAGDVYLTVMHSQGINDLNEPGLFVQIDGGEGVYFDLDTFYTKQTLKIASDLVAGAHTIQISKSVDSKNGALYIYSLSYSGNIQTAQAKTRKIQFVGDSITAGFGVVTKSYDPLGIVTDGVYTNKTYSYYSYANTVADALDAEYYSIANGGWYFSSSESADIENKSITRIYDEQSMLIELGAYDHSAWQPDVVVINLGTNDATLKDADGNLVVTEAQYMTDVAVMIDQVRNANPNAKIIWAYGAMGNTSNMPNGSLENWITAAIEAYNADKEAAMQVTYVQLPTYQDGLWAHPSVDGQKEIGQVLADEIAALMGWN